MIFVNISNKLEIANTGSKILVVCGSGHFYEQAGRFLKNGFEEREIRKKSDYFDSRDEKFEYPDSIEKIWEQRVYFYAYTFPKIVGQNEILNNDIKAEFTEGNHDAFYYQQLKYCEVFSGNELYK